MKSLFIRQRKHQGRGTLVCLCQTTWVLLQYNRNSSSKDQGMCVSGRTASCFTHFLHLSSFRWVILQHQQCSAFSFNLPDPQIVKDSCIPLSVHQTCSMNQLRGGGQWHCCSHLEDNSERTLNLLRWKELDLPSNCSVWMEINNDWHRLCFFLTEETKNTCCATCKGCCIPKSFLQSLWLINDAQAL